MHDLYCILSSGLTHQTCCPQSDLTFLDITCAHPEHLELTFDPTETANVAHLNNMTVQIALN